MKFATKITVSLACAAVGMLAMTLSPSHADDKHPTTAPSSAKESNVPAVLQFKTKSLTGEDVDLSKYQGKVIIFVNTASKCGYKTQLKDLEDLHEKYKDKGLVVLAFPSGDFKDQEFETAKETAEFCQLTYGVKYDLFEKSHVKGPDQVPLFKFLTSEETSPFPGEIK